MSSYTKHFGLLLGAALCAAPAFAIISNPSDELYSETIYIQKSSAEVPQALASNASPSEDSPTVNSTDSSIESVQEMTEDAPAPKKAAKRRRSKK